MQRKIRRITAALLALVFSAACLAGCSGDSASVQAGEKTEVSSSGAETGELGEGFVFTIYNDKTTDAFQSLGDDVQNLNIRAENGEPQTIRFVCSEDDVTVTLEAVEWIDSVCYLHPCETVFSIQADAGVVYEFDGSMTEELPAYCLTAERGDYSASWYMTYSGPYEGGVVELTGEAGGSMFPPEDGDFMSILCRMYAMTSVYAGDDIRNMPEFFWPAITGAVTNVTMQTSDPDAEGRIYLPEWLMDDYANALFPGAEYPEIQMWDSVTYDSNREEPYVVYADTQDLEEMTRYLYTEFLEDEDYVVYIAVNVGERGEVTAAVRVSPSDTDTPFGWEITGYEIVPAVG